MSFPVTVGLGYGEEKVTSDTKQRPLGTRGVTPDGRVFYYAQAGASALVAGNTVQSKVAHGASVHVSGLTIVNATATGVTTLSVTLATTNATRDQYADGYLTVDTSPGQAMYKVRSHPPIDSAADGEFTLYDNDQIVAAMTSGTTLVGLRENPFASVIAAPTTATGIVVGVVPVAVGAGEFFWAQTYGPAIVNTDTAPVAGEILITPGASAGHATVNAATSADNSDDRKQVIGVAQTAGAGADKYNYIFLTIRA